MDVGQFTDAKQSTKTVMAIVAFQIRQLHQTLNVLEVEQRVRASA